MTLVDEREVMLEQEKKQKLMKNIIKLILILLVMAIILIIVINIKNSKTFKFYIDGEKKADVDDSILLKDEKGKILVENGDVYISIRKLATALNYQYYNSEYKQKGEDRSKCQVRANNIYSSYISDSNKFYKTIVTENKVSEENKKKDENGFSEIEEAFLTSYEYFDLGSNVRIVNDELYANISAINLGLDVVVTYNSKNRSLNVTTLDYLEDMAKSKRKDVISSDSYSYANKRLLKYGMAIITDSEGNLGVGSFTDPNKLNSFVASCKYSEIEFNEATKTLSAKTSNDKKICLLYLNLDTQEVVNNKTTQYADIKPATNNFDYFVVKNNDGKSGIVNIDDNTVVPIEFEQIGVNDNLYSDLDSKYILDNKYIPVKQNDLWGLYDLTGKNLVAPKYFDIGCGLSQSGNSTVIVPDVKGNIKGIVFLYNKEKSLYGLYNAETGETIALSLIEVFKKVENGENNYYINYTLDRKSSNVHTLNVKTDL